MTVFNDTFYTSEVFALLEKDDTNEVSNFIAAVSDNLGVRFTEYTNLFFVDEYVFNDILRAEFEEIHPEFVKLPAYVKDAIDWVKLFATLSEGYSKVYVNQTTYFYRNA